MILQEATNVLEQTNFFKNKSLYAYQNNKNSYQANLALIEDMNEAMTYGKCGIAITADLEGAFDSIWRE